jgi:hypothetical protein
MRSCLSTLLLLFIATGLSAADEKNSDRTQVPKFLKEHVINKTIVSPKATYKIDEGRIESDYEDVTTYSEFTESSRGFSFDMTIAKKYIRYDVGADGKRTLPGIERNPVEVYRYEIGERVSTMKLTGICRMLSTTSPSTAPSRHGTVMLVTGMRVTDGKLGWLESVPGYLDMAAPGGKFQPGSTDETSTFSIVRGRLRLAGTSVVYDVDPETLKRTPKKEKPIVFVAEEADNKSSQ